MRKLLIASLVTLIASTTSFDSALARARCGRSYPNIALPKLVEVYKQSYLADGFKVVNSNVKNTSATLRITFLKKGLNYRKDLEYNFDPVPGAIHVCGSLHDPAWENQSLNSVRYTYSVIFANAQAKATKRIENEIPVRR
jgi:hypothetical protein